MEPVRQVRVAVRVRGIEGDVAQEFLIDIGTRSIAMWPMAVAERLGPGGEELGPHGRAGVVAFLSCGLQWRF